MSPPTLSLPTAARRLAFLFLAAAALLAAAGPTAGGQPPAKAEPQDLKLRWEVEAKNAPTGAMPLFDHDGLLVVLTGRNKVEAVSFHARTGKPGPELPAPPNNSFSEHTFVLEKGKFAFQQGSARDPGLVIWETASGKASRTPFQPVGTSTPRLEVSPSGRYTAVTEYRYVKDTARPAEAPFRVSDGKTGKAVVSFDWLFGSAHFTDDGSRVLAVDATDRFRWFKLPGGQPDGEWKFDREPTYRSRAVLDMSADGGVLLYTGAPPKGEQGVHLLDGRTGAVRHSFPARTYLGHQGHLSPDGGTVALVRTDGFGTGHTLEVLDAKGTLLARVKFPAVPVANAYVTATVSWEARAVALYERESKRLWVYDLPGGAGAVVPRPVAREAAASRPPVPSDPAVARAEASVRQVLKAEYARKGPAEQKALAQKLLKLADETADDPAARYVMLRDARDFAQTAGDPVLAVQAVDALAKWYQVDGPVMQLAALEKVLAAGSAPATAKAVADAATVSARAAADDDEYDEAVQFAQLAANAARKGKLPPAAVEDADYAHTQAKKARDAFAAVRPALDKLRTAPDDPAANSVVGVFRLTVQNRWDDGLRHLARGGDAALRAVAELDLKTPRAGVPADAKVADAWWEYAQAAPADLQWAAGARARHWYGRCIPGLAGLNKVRAEGRLGFTAGGVEYRPGLVCELSAKQPAVLKGKKTRVDPVLDFSGGEFSDGTKQTDLTLKWAGALVPPRAGRYTLVAQTTDPVKVRVDGKLVIDTMSPGAGSKREAAVTLGEKATPVAVEFSAPNTDRHKIKLAWVVPGGSGEELVPAECLFHDKRAEAVLGK